MSHILVRVISSGFHIKYSALYIGKVKVQLEFLIFHKIIDIFFSFQNLHLQTRVFINAGCIDLMLVVISPLLLLYSSAELRNTVQIIIKNMLRK